VSCGVRRPLRQAIEQVVDDRAGQRANAVSFRFLLSDL